MYVRRRDMYALYDLVAIDNRGRYCKNRQEALATDRSMSASNRISSLAPRHHNRRLRPINQQSLNRVQRRHLLS